MPYFLKSKVLLLHRSCINKKVMFCRYRGLCLLDAIDSLRPPIRDVSKPLILPICDVIRSQSMGQLAACGKLEAGAIRNGSKVITYAIKLTVYEDNNLC